MSNIIYLCANMCPLVLVVFCVQQASTQGLVNEDFSEKIERLHTVNDMDSIRKESINVRRKLRFLGDTPSTIFINTLSVVSSIFTIWSFIETRDDVKEAKHMKFNMETNESEKMELLEELIHKLDGLHSGVQQEMASIRRSLRQLICRFDAVHAKTKDINQACLQFIRPLNQVSAKQSVKNFHRKTYPGDTSNTLLKYDGIQ